MPKKIPKISNLPPSAKKPRLDPSIKSSYDEKPVWQVSRLDVDGPWGWMNIDKAYFFMQILPKIRNFESMLWKDILNRNSHEVNIE